GIYFEKENMVTFSLRKGLFLLFFFVYGDSNFDLTSSASYATLNKWIFLYNYSIEGVHHDQ
ncbi:MAG: hypothetical protein K2J79_03045, partial [Ruminiclostridium sp.]|nr:hypothetical protein [Ruminiclostridium sp.]